jgi:hypothetical protein
MTGPVLTLCPAFFSSTNAPSRIPLAAQWHTHYYPIRSRTHSEHRSSQRPSLREKTTP